MQITNDKRRSLLQPKRSEYKLRDADYIGQIAKYLAVSADLSGPWLIQFPCLRVIQ
jgi:hypothetical protein